MEPPMSDLIGEIQRRIAYLQDCLTCSKCLDEPTECTACTHYRQELELQEKSLTRLRELESGVTVSRECAEKAIPIIEAIAKYGCMDWQREEIQAVADELRAALSRQSSQQESE